MSSLKWKDAVTKHPLTIVIKDIQNYIETKKDKIIPLPYEWKSKVADFLCYHYIYVCVCLCVFAMSVVIALA